MDKNDEWVVQEQQRQFTLLPPAEPVVDDDDEEGQEQQEQPPVQPVAPAPAPVDPALAYAASIADPVQRQAFLTAYMASVNPAPQAAPVAPVAPAAPEKGKFETELEKAQARLAEIKAKYDSDWATGRYSSYQEWNQENFALAQEYDALRVDVERVLPRMVEQERMTAEQRAAQERFQQSSQVALQAPQLAQTLVNNLPAWVRQQVSDAEALAYYTANIQQIAAQGEGDLFTNPNRSAQLQQLFNLSVTDLMNRKAAGQLPVAPTIPVQPQPGTGLPATPPAPPSAAPFYAQGLTPAPIAPAQQKPGIPKGYGTRDLTDIL